MKLFQTPPPSNIEKPRAWIFKMTSNLAIDSIRKKRDQVAFTEDSLSHTHKGKKNYEIKIDIEDAIKKLELQERQIVTLRLNDEMKFKEIAEVIDQPLGTILWRYQYWETTENYPENLGFIRVNENQTTWEIGLVENTSETRQEILNLVPNSADSITFMDAAYSLNQLSQVQEEIVQEFLIDDEHLIYSIGIMSDKILITVDEENIEEYTNLFNDRYGDIVQVEIGFPAELDEETVLYGEDDSSPIQTSWRTGFVLAGIALVVVFIFWQRNQQIAKKQTSIGHQIDETQSLSVAEIEQLIKEMKHEPSDDVYHSILKLINEKN